MNGKTLYVPAFRAALIFILILGMSGPVFLHASDERHITLLEDGEYFQAFMRGVGEAKREIVMSFFLFKTNGYSTNRPDRVLAALGFAAERGVRVRIILERGNGGEDSSVDASNRETAERLREKGIKVIFDSPRVTTHTKAAVIDGRYIFLGSHNLTNSALKYNRELSVYIDSPPLAEEVLRYIGSLDE